jgi:Kdo2-lipid IVA lauroyltransferase/acyltransferase
MYYVVYGFLWLLSLLPLRILYIIADGFYGLAFYIFKYRRDVVMKNLMIAFPEKTEKERKTIAKKFYHNLIDMFIETLKMLSVSEKVLEKRFTANWDLINTVHSTGKSLQIHVGHNFNWEWGNLVMTKQTVYKLLAVYMPLANKIMERLFYKIRTRNGAVFLRATHMKEDFLPYQNTQYLIGLVADQNPGHPANAWWFNFFGRPTPFLKGPAKAALANNTAVVFAFIHKPRRGYYEAIFSPAVDITGSTTEQELTQKFVVYLEEVIKKYPDMWLWTHRRWKHEWKPDYGNIIE